jgi:ATP-dependent RNA helicase DDX60
MDEVHNIVEVDKGPQYERILALLPCPVIALSATIGNAQELWEWLRSVTEARGQRMAPLVEHYGRWADLRMHIHLPPDVVASGVSSQPLCSLQWM